MSKLRSQVVIALVAGFVAGLAGCGAPLLAQDLIGPKPQPLIEAPNLPGSPYPKRFEIAEFPRGLTWLNTAGPLRLKHDLKGKFVLLDFWTFCCINCMQQLPELKKLEEAYPNQLVVIGVHTAKFATERESESIREAIIRYGISHPVINDRDRVLWTLCGIQTWPTLILIDPQGYVVWVGIGENKFEALDKIVGPGVSFYRRRKMLDERPVHFHLARAEVEETPLRFPGKVLADEASGRLFIADSSHHRIIVTTLAGKLVDVIGTGEAGKTNGSYDKAEFNNPQGMALRGSRLLVADTGNHMIRAIDLDQKAVSLFAGTGLPGLGWPGSDRIGALSKWPEFRSGPARRTSFSSPWDLCIQGNFLYIAMAGPHQIWRMPVGGGEIGPYAGNGREDIVDGPLLPKQPFTLGFSSFAQPSGLATDGKLLYVADSEGSSIRAVPFDADGDVRTIVGSANVPQMRLFAYGDIDGRGDTVRLQHPLAVVARAGKLFVADTYNHKVKAIDPLTRTAATLVGTGKPGRDDAAGTFFEPAGLSYAAGKLYVADTNNHLIRVVELGPQAKVSTLPIAGLQPPSSAAAAKPPSFDDAQQVQAGEFAVTPGKDGKVRMQVELTLPEGWKINSLAPTAWYLGVERATGPLDRAAAGVRNKIASPKASFEIAIPAKLTTGEEDIRIGLVYYICQTEGEGLCRVAAVQWKAKLRLVPAESSIAKLVAKIDPEGEIRKPAAPGGR